MGKLSPILRSLEGGRIAFWCPGCDEVHQVVVSGPGAWGYNGDPDKPTFTPSVLVTAGHYVSTYKPGDDCWCTFEARTGRASRFKCKRCHSFVRDGRIEYLSDCSHALAGQAVPLPAWPQELQ